MHIFRYRAAHESMAAQGLRQREDGIKDRHLKQRSGCSPYLYMHSLNQLPSGSGLWWVVGSRSFSPFKCHRGSWLTRVSTASGLVLSHNNWSQAASGPSNNSFVHLVGNVHLACCGDEMRSPSRSLMDFHGQARALRANASWSDGFSPRVTGQHAGRGAKRHILSTFSPIHA